MHVAVWLQISGIQSSPQKGQGDNKDSSYIGTRDRISVSTVEDAMSSPVIPVSLWPLLKVAYKYG